MKLQVKFRGNDYADCDIRIQAKGFLVAVIYWATETEILAGWSQIAAVSIDVKGKGFFCLDGQRAIPMEATHICARCITPDFATIEEVFVEIPQDARAKATKIQSLQLAKFSLMSDLHLAGKTGRICKALSMTESDTILISGDLTNDGFTEQFDSFKCCMEETVPNKRVFSVTGNHDQLYAPNPDILEQYKGYQAFQDFLLERVKYQGMQVEIDQSGAYAVEVEDADVEIIGLQCVTYYRKFVFPEGAQLKWLKQHLSTNDNDGWHIILCHAPLIAHNPHRNEGEPYFNRNDELQKIIEQNKKIIFISGHTHVSPNMKKNCVEYVPETQTVYINDGSVTPTELNGEILMPAEWKDGVVMELCVYEDGVEVKAKSVHTGIYYPRGYYRFDLKSNDIK